MNSKSLMAALTIVFATVLFCGCTEKLPLSPVYTNDSDWTPSISIFENGHQRVEVLIDRPTRKELWRNISFLTLQARRANSPSFDDIDTLQGYRAAPTEARNQPPISFLSSPFLSFDTDYSLRVSVHFMTGDTRFSNELAIRTPPSVGKVLKRIQPQSQPQEGFYYSGNLFLSFWKSSLLMLNGRELIRVDTSSGQLTWLTRNFNPPYDGGEFFPTFTIIGDTAYSFYSDPYDRSKTHLVSMNLYALRVDSSLIISTPGKSLGSVVSHKGELYGLWWTAQKNQQCGVINPRTGEVVRWLAEAPFPAVSPEGLSSDGINLFYCYFNDFDNRIIAFDPLSMKASQENRNPIFSSTGLAWD